MLLARMAHGTRVCNFAGVKIALDLAEPAHRSIYVNGDFEPELSLALRRAMHPGDVFLDIGANLGWHTLHLLARRKDVAIAYAVEPQQRNIELLNLALKANNLDRRCRVKRLALGAKPGKVVLKKFEGLDSMHASAYALGDLPFQEEEVPCETVDDLVSVMDSAPSVVKCDVEGSEFEVLQGAERTLRGHRGAPPLWFLEANYETSAMAGYFPWNLIEWAANYGYHSYTIRSGGITAVSPKGLRHGDTLVLAIPEIHGSRLNFN